MAESPDPSITVLDAELARLRTQIVALADIPDAQADLQAVLTEKERQRAALLGQPPEAAPSAPQIHGPVTAGRDAIVGINVQVTNGLPDAAQVRCKWLEHLIQHYAATALALPLPPASDAAVVAATSTIPELATKTVRDLRRHLAVGLATLPGDLLPPAALEVTIAAQMLASVLGTLVDMPPTALPALWPRALALLADDAVAALVRDTHLRFVRAPIAQRPTVLDGFEQALSQSQYAPGLHRLLCYLAADERRDALFVEGATAAKSWRGLSGQPPDTRLKYLLLGAASGTAVGAAVTAAVMASSAHAAAPAPAAQHATPTPTPVTPPPPAAPARPAAAWSIPVTPEEWRDELARRNERFGAPEGYWCYVKGRTYTIGGWEPGEPSARIELKPFWIARVPITVAQYAPFVAEGYRDSAHRWWTSNGWSKLEQSRRTQPSFYWGEKSFNASNQPAMDITWYEATAYTLWLRELLADLLPTDYVLRLPTEAEWEAAAAFNERGVRHRYPWGEQEPTSELAVFDGLLSDGPPIVGSCPAGAAACGALDMAGTIWECVASLWDAYPSWSGHVVQDVVDDTRDIVWRGGSFWMGKAFARCDARAQLYPQFQFAHRYGFRVVIAAQNTL